MFEYDGLYDCGINVNFDVNKLRILTFIRHLNKEFLFFDTFFLIISVISYIKCFNFLLYCHVVFFRAK